MLIALKSSRQATATGTITVIDPTVTASVRLIFVLKAPEWKVMVCNFKRKISGLQMKYG